MPIVSDVPIVVPSVPAVDQKVFDLWWVRRLRMDAETPTAVSLQTWFARARSENDVTEILADGGAYMPIDDLFALVKEQPELGPLVDDVVVALGNLAKARGLIK